MHFVQHVVDAFTDRPFRGNPAAVVHLDDDLPESLMQAIAAENNLSETAFVAPAAADGTRRLRWFTPKVEVALCGHATLATAASLADLGDAGPWRFSTRSGPLAVTREGKRFVLDFPAWVPAPAQAPEGLAAALGATPREVWKARDWICVFDTPAEIETLDPDHGLIAALPGERVIATATGGEGGVDVTSRYFAAKVGIAEDPVTGAAHTQLVPFWAARLGRTRLLCRQASRRGGLLHTELVGERVRMGGEAVIFARGTIALPADAAI
jgi:predicted PhzF superfamily epimerase YddE/YHI9